MEGTVEVKRSRGRPARRWHDDFKEWAGVDKIYAAYNVIKEKKVLPNIYYIKYKNFVYNFFDLRSRTPFSNGASVQIQNCQRTLISSIYRKN